MNRLRRIIGSQRRDERGLGVVIVALMMIPILIASATAIDVSNARSEAVLLQATTDSAALAAVPDLPVSNDDFSGRLAARERALSFVKQNLKLNSLPSRSCASPSPVAVPYAETCYSSGRFDVAITTPYYVGAGSTPGHQRIRVEVCENTANFFSESAGLTPPRVCRSSVAASVQGGGGTALRPFGLCVDSNGSISDLVRNGIIPSAPLQITYSKSQPNACNGGSSVPGNWGMIDFNGGSNSNAETKDWVENGYPGVVEMGTLGGTCASEPNACYAGDTGAFSNSLDSGLDYLVSSSIVFALPVFDQASGNGANSQLHVVAFISVRLVDYRATGSESSRYLTLRIVAPGVIPGPTCCDQSASLQQ